MTKEKILQHTDSYKILNYYLRPYVPENHWPLRKGFNISNPLIGRKQQTPSFNIFPGEGGNWFYKDFSSSSQMQGDCFDFVMKLHAVSFPEALKTIARDFFIEDVSYRRDRGLESPKKPKFELILRKAFLPEEKVWWESYGITAEHLEKMEVKSVERIILILKDGKPWPRISTLDCPIYAYQIGPGAYKIYQPLARDHRFSYLGNKPKDYVFGLSKLPEKGERVFITGGEKDVLSLTAHGYPAICFNSETAKPPQGLIARLKSRFKRVIVCYDLDKVGMTESERLASANGLYRLLLPPEIYHHGKGKDISDFFKLLELGNTPEIAAPDTLEQLITQVEADIPPVPPIPKGGHLEKLIRHQEELRKRKAKEIVFAPPILLRSEDPVIFPRTINLIQGQSGVHKSRLAEAICSTLLRQRYWTHNAIGFEVNSSEEFAVCYVDTERNLTEQFPYAIQQIQKKAGYNITDNPKHFHYVTLLDFPREERFNTLTLYLDWVRQQHNQHHLFVVLDVISDCIGNFNDVNESLELVDAMNRRINQYNVTFLCVVHENPGQSDKPRGHLGTELANKASTVLQVARERDSNGNPTELIKLSYLKCRSSKAHDPVYLEYSPESKGLILAGHELVKQVERTKTKAPILEVREYIEANIGEGVPSRELMADLSAHFDCGQNVVYKRISKIIKEEWLLTNPEGKKGYLVRLGGTRDRMLKIKLAKE